MNVVEWILKEKLLTFREKLSDFRIDFKFVAGIFMTSSAFYENIWQMSEGICPKVKQKSLAKLKIIQLKFITTPASTKNSHRPAIKTN